MEKTKHITIKEFSKIDTETRLKDQSDIIVVKKLDSSKSIDEATRQATFVITTDTPDTDADIIVPEGINFSHYKNNPVVLWQHDRNQLPIGKCIDIKKVDNGWKAVVQFVPADVSPFAEQVYQMVKGGFLSAVSIGFLPTDLDPNSHGGFTINKCFLFEFSVVTVPANPEALLIDVKSANDVDNTDNVYNEFETISELEDVIEDTSKENEIENEVTEDNNDKNTKNIDIQKRKLKSKLTLISINKNTNNQ